MPKEEKALAVPGLLLSSISILPSRITNGHFSFGL